MKEFDSVKDNKHIGVCSIYDIDGNLVKQLKRVPTINDKPLIKEGGKIIQKPEFFGEWIDTTDEAKQKLKLKKKVAKTGKTEKELEIEAAEELLRQLKGTKA